MGVCGVGVGVQGSSVGTLGFRVELCGVVFGVKEWGGAV